MPDFKSVNPYEVPKSTRRVKELNALVDKHSAILRCQAGVGLDERLDPWAVAPAFGLAFVQPNTVDGATDEDKSTASKLTAKNWSGMARSRPDGNILVMLNPNQTPERANVTIMEEVSHVHLGHKPVKIITAGDCFQREYDPVIEQEAYWLAAGTLLPSQSVGRLVWKGMTAEQIGTRFGVSSELVAFRVKILRLWPDYQARQRQREQKEAA